MEQEYAQALWQMIESGTQPKPALHALVESLKARGREMLLPRIARAFERLAARELQKNALVVSVAHEKDSARAKREAKRILDELSVDAKDIDVKTDESLIGGWRLEGRGILIDESFKKKLLDMYNAAIA